MNCDNCKVVIPQGAKFCQNCGQSTGAEPPMCQSCGAVNAQGANFCAECGAAQSTQDAASRTTSPEVPPTQTPAAKAAPAPEQPGETEEFWGPEPDYGKIPWVRIVILVFGVFIVWAAFASGQIVGQFNPILPIILLFLFLSIINRIMLKPKKIYYSINKMGLSYLNNNGSMSPIAWAEMERVEIFDGDEGILKLFWRGHREIESTPNWMDRLLTKLTGKVHKGGTPYVENAAMERSVNLNGKMMAPNGSSFGDRFQARFAVKA